MGKPVEQAGELAKTASPVYQTDPVDPPLLIAHGDQNNQLPVNQSLELMAAYKKNGLPVQIEFVPGVGRGDNVYYKRDILMVVEKFLARVKKDYF